MHPLLNIAITAARQAGDIINRHTDLLHRLVITEKGENDFFCEVDIKSEKAIIQHIHKAYPEHGIIAEESGGYNEDAPIVWIIDPLDGTNNYLHGFPFYSVSIAVRVKDKIEHGVIFDPIRHELFTASLGRGAQLNNRRIRVSKKSELPKSLIAAGFPIKKLHEAKKFLPLFEALFKKCTATRRTGSSALDLAYLACGRLDGLLGFSLKNWDIAAGTLLVQEAGGLIGDPFGGDINFKKGHLLAGSPKIYKEISSTIEEVLKELPQI